MIAFHEAVAGFTKDETSYEDANTLQKGILPHHPHITFTESDAYIL